MSAHISEVRVRVWRSEHKGVLPATGLVRSFRLNNFKFCPWFDLFFLVQFVSGRKGAGSRREKSCNTISSGDWTHQK